VRVSGDIGWLIYVGDSDAYRTTILETLFPNGYTESDMGRVLFWKLPKLVQEWSQTNDLVLCRVGGFFPWHVCAPYAFDTYPVIHQIMSLDQSPDEMLQGHSRHKLRHKVNKMLKQNFTSRISRSAEDLDFFYHRMYVPTVHERHQHRAHTTSHQLFEEVLKSGFLLFISLDGVEIAGCLCDIKYNIFTFYDMGLLNGDESWLKRDVNIALYWHRIQYAFNTGAKAINLGLTKSWVNDGIFQFKSQWNTKVSRDPYRVARDSYLREKLLFRAQTLPDRWRERLNSIGFITRHGDQYLRVFIDRVDPSVEEAHAQAIKDGLDGIQIITPGQHEDYGALVLQEVAE
jgi:hypothetical protein